MKALIHVRDDNMCTVRLSQETLCSMAGLRHCFATLNPNNFVVHGQKHKMWVLIFLKGTATLVTTIFYMKDLIKP